MNSRERVERAITFAGPDRIPIAHTYLPGAMHRHGNALRALFQEFPSDFGGVGPGNAVPYPETAGTLTDDWGCVWEAATGDYIGQVIVHPLADWKALSGFRCPQHFPDGSIEQVKEEIAAIRNSDNDLFIMADWLVYFERIQWLRGYESLMYDLAGGSPELEKLADTLLEHQISVIETWGKLDVDAVMFGDDWGTQISMIVSPKTWRGFFKPRYKAMFDAVHASGRKVFFHSDGYTLPIIPDLIEIGVNLFNPQLPCMDFAEVAAVVSGKLALWGGADRQFYLPKGTPEQVREHCIAICSAFATKQGGYMGTGELGPDAPLENARAMFEAFRDFTPS